jgi:hypothetical protein
LDFLGNGFQKWHSTGDLFRVKVYGDRIRPLPFALERIMLGNVDRIEDNFSGKTYVQPIKFS